MSVSSFLCLGFSFCVFVAFGWLVPFPCFVLFSLVFLSEGFGLVLEFHSFGFGNKVSLWNSGWPQAHGNPPASSSQKLR